MNNLTKLFSRKWNQKNNEMYCGSKGSSSDRNNQSVEKSNDNFKKNSM
jgi:hypothetical protein